MEAAHRHDGLAGFFTPKHIALLGASDRSTWSRNVWNNLSGGISDLTVSLVNPHQSIVHGQRAIPSVFDVTGEPDLAFVMTPATATLEAIEEAADVGIRDFVVLSAGFDEVDAARAARLAELCRQKDLRLLGPNASGFVNVSDGVSPYALGLPGRLVPGGVTLVLQSGGLLSSTVHAAYAAGLGLRLVCALGNETQISAEDVIVHAVADEETRVIAMFLEAIRHPDAFARAAQSARDAGKPLVVMKAGRSEAGSRAALSHTGALAGDDDVIDAVLADLGVSRVDSIEELLTVAAILERYPTGAASRVAVVSASGGQNNVAADVAELHGLRLPDLPVDLAKELAEMLPYYATAHNPLDVTGAAVNDPSLLPRSISVLAKSADAFDWIVAGVFQPALLAGSAEERDVRLDLVADAVRRAEVPVVLHTAVATQMSSEQAQALRDRGLVLLGGTDLVVRSIAGIADFVARRELPEATGEIHAFASQSVTEPGTLDEWQARELLAAAGVPFPPAILARSRREAETAAEQVGGPSQRVVLKIVARDLPHKTEAGGVMLDVPVSEAGDAYEKLVARVAALRPSLSRGGVMVVQQAVAGVEMVAGVVTDENWGRLLVFGLGGLWVEVLGDVVRIPLPTSRERIQHGLTRLKGAALLNGIRGAPVCDQAALIDAIWCLALLSDAYPTITSVEVNPLLALENGVQALDALVVMAGEEGVR